MSTGNPLFDYVSSTAISLTMAGNTGISPFLTLFLLGLIELIKPELLNMGPTMERLLASGWSMCILGALAVAELVAKCVPALDEMVDSAETFVVPVISILSTMATMGLLPGAGESYDAQDDVGQGTSIDAIGMFDRDEDYRYLQYDEGVIENGGGGFSEGFMSFTKVSLVIIGMGLALSVHIFKMIVRVSSLVCSGGCCQPCITILEYTTVIVGVILAIVLPAFAIIACIVLVGIALYVIRLKCGKKKEEGDDETGGNERKSSGETKELEWEKADPNDVEDQSKDSVAKATQPPPGEAFVIGALEEVPFDKHMSPPASPDPKYDAKTY